MIEVTKAFKKRSHEILITATTQILIDQPDEVIQYEAKLGTLSDPVTGTASLAKTTTWFTMQSLPVASTLKEFKIYCSVAGTLKIKVAKPIKGGGFNIISDQQVTCVVGVNTFSVAEETLTAVEMPPYCLVGFHTPSNGGATARVITQTNPRSEAGYFSGTGDLTGNGVSIGLEVLYAGELQMQYKADYLSSATIGDYWLDEDFAGGILPAYAQNVSANPWTISAGKVTNTEAGLDTSFFDFYPTTNTDRCTWAIEFEFKAAGDRFCVYRKPMLIGSVVDEGTIIEADLDNNQIVFYEQWRGYVYPLTEVSSTHELTNLTLATGVRYRLELIKVAKLITARITDLSNNATQSFTIDNYPTSLCGLGFGVPGFAALAGTVDVFDAKFSTLVTDPEILILGDSITETPVGYAQQLLDDLDGNGWIDGDGGTDSLNCLRRLRHDLRFSRPRYVVVMIGVNNAASDAGRDSFMIDMQNIYTTIVDANATPIICTVLPTTNATRNARVTTMNEALRATGWDLIRVDIAVSVGGDGTTADANLFSDILHPNTAGHALIKARFAIDKPEIFS